MQLRDIQQSEIVEALRRLNIEVKPNTVFLHNGMTQCHFVGPDTPMFSFTGWESLWLQVILEITCIREEAIDSVVKPKHTL